MLHAIVRDHGASLAADSRILIHGTVMKQLGLATGMHVTVSNTNNMLFAGTVWPSFEIPISAVSLPALLAIPANVTNDMEIELHQATASTHTIATARVLHVFLEPLSTPNALKDGSNLLKNLLRTILIHLFLDLSVVKLGSTFEFTFQKHKFHATVQGAQSDQNHSIDNGLVLITRETNLDWIDTEKATNESLVNADAYEALGGLDTQIASIRLLVELPLTQPDLYKQYGLQPPKGILLYGPPGTGKTSLARTVANSLNAQVFNINGPELSSTFHGETESKLREVFERAKSCERAIVVMDEIDALAPRRDASAAVHTEGAGEVERRVVATLLTLLDGLESNAKGRVVVIAATNRPNALDPALRRPGRLDSEIEVGVPDRDARHSILRVLLRNVPYQLTDQELESIAARTHGYVGADLSALVREAGMQAITRRLDPTLHGSMTRLSLQTSDEPLEKVRMPDFNYAQTIVRPSAMREVFVETPKIRWSDIADNGEVLELDGEKIPSVQRQIRECVEWPLKFAATFQRLGIEAPKGALLYGPPGCSKTMTAKALAGESGLNFFTVRGPELISKYVGESERAIREMFRRARSAAPSILFFDELDAISGLRSQDTSNASNDRIVASLLTEMDGIDTESHVVVIAATNRPDCIDPALLRPGRMDRLVYVGPPDLQARHKILQLRTTKMALCHDVDLKHIAEITSGCSGAEIVSICQEAGLLAMNEDQQCQEIAMRHFDSAARHIRRRITPQMLADYSKWRKQR
ncbi:AAA+-type ATPase [Malassezia psittaci]|uniref:AAA+-type ATPase n=1 Tax=Malassezia psittaci TaxID=1821823 RepID=A0AAF0JFD2_9BASI|nr:AAA+-type ATPase [Malassezia psittaci]